MLTGQVPLNGRRQPRFAFTRTDMDIALRRGAPATTLRAIDALDVSTTGIKFVSPVALGFGERIKLHISGVTEEDFMIAAEVRWIRQRDGGQEWIVGCSIETACPDSWFEDLAERGYIDRRQSARLESNAAAIAHFPGESHDVPVTIINYSTDGVCLLVPEAIEADCPMILELQPNGDSVILRACSRWQMRFKSSFMVGCQLAPADRGEQATELIKSLSRTTDTQVIDTNSRATDTELIESSAQLDTHVMEDPNKTAVLEPVASGDDQDVEDLNFDDDVILEPEPLLDTLDELDSHVSDIFGEQDEVNEIDPESDLFPAAVEEVVGETSREEPTEEIASQASIDLAPTVEEALSQPAPSPPAVVDEQSPPAIVTPKSQPRRRPIARLVGLVLAIELLIGIYFGAFYLNWDQRDSNAVESERLSYRHMQAVSEYVFYPAASFERWMGS